jgi:hypothetical protein
MGNGLDVHDQATEPVVRVRRHTQRVNPIPSPNAR